MTGGTRVIWLTLGMLPYLSLVGADTWMHEAARKVPPTERVIHWTLAPLLIGFLVAVFLERTPIANARDASGPTGVDVEDERRRVRDEQAQVRVGAERRSREGLRVGCAAERRAGREPGDERDEDRCDALHCSVLHPGDVRGSGYGRRPCSSRSATSESTCTCACHAAPAPGG